MSVTLPPILPTSRPSAPSARSASSLGRAQNFSVSKLQQQQDRDRAKVSMNQAITEQSRKNGTGASVSALHNQQKPQTSTSYSHPSSYTIYDDDVLYDRRADDRRWKYIRKLIKERKDKEDSSS